MILVVISLSNKSFYETKNKFMAGLWLHLLSKFDYVRESVKSVICVSWGDACWETDGSSLENVQATHRTSSACVFLSSMSACVRVLLKELDAWLWVIEDVLKDSPAGEAGNREA